MQLFEFVINLRSHRRVTDIGIDLAQRGHADAHGFELGMIDVGRDNHASTSYLVSRLPSREFLPVGHVSHFLGDDSLARIAHLREIASSIYSFAACDPFSSG